MRTRQKCVATDTRRPLGCRTTPLEHWSRRKPTVEPRWAKQQTKKLRPKPTKINSFISGPSLSLNRFYVATILAVGSAVVHKHTRYSVRVKDLSLIDASKQQTYKSRFNTEMEQNYYNSKTNTKTMEQHKSSSWIPVVPTKDRASGY